MSGLVDRAFDVFEAGLLLTGLGTMLYGIRQLVDSRGLRKWWRMESWRERWARWNRQLNV